MPSLPLLVSAAPHEQLGHLQAPAGASRVARVLSTPPEMIVFPSGEKATDKPMAECPVNVIISLQAIASSFGMSNIVPALPQCPVASLVLSGENRNGIRCQAA